MYDYNPYLNYTQSSKQHGIGTCLSSQFWLFWGDAYNLSLVHVVFRTFMHTEICNCKKSVSVLFVYLEKEEKKVTKIYTSPWTRLNCKEINFWWCIYTLTLYMYLHVSTLWIQLSICILIFYLKINIYPRILNRRDLNFINAIKCFYFRNLSP